MINYYKKDNNALVEIDQIEDGCWVNITPPFNPDALKALSEEQNIPLDYLLDSLDIDERSRFELEDDVLFIVLKASLPNDHGTQNEPSFITIPIGIVLTQKNIFTISAYDSIITQDMAKNKIRNLDPKDPHQFILKIFERNVFYYLQHLNELNNNRAIFEQKMVKDLNNEKLFQLMNIEKSLVYFATSLRTNEVMMTRLNRTKTIPFTEEQVDFLEDIVIDNSQALEMANIYTNILSSTMDTFASIISNNMNSIMRRLTSVTLILMVPTLVASLYGMNVKLPLSNNAYAFPIIVGISLVCVAITSIYFRKNKWF